MSNIRIIARLDIKGPNLIKGVQLEGLRVIGNPNKFALRYYQEQVDEIIFKKLKDRDSEVDEVFRDLQREMDQVEKRLLNEIRSLRNDISGRVGVLEKYRWIILGGFLAIGWILSKNFKFIMQMMSGTGLN